MENSSPVEVELLTISVPQFEIHPFVYAAAVLRAPVLDLETLQNPGVMPHCP